MNSSSREGLGQHSVYDPFDCQNLLFNVNFDQVSLCPRLTMHIGTKCCASLTLPQVNVHNDTKYCPSYVVLCYAYIMHIDTLQSSHQYILRDIGFQHSRWYMCVWVYNACVDSHIYHSSCMRNYRVDTQMDRRTALISVVEQLRYPKN